MKLPFVDGLKNLLSSLANTRNAAAANTITASRIDPAELRAIYRSGLGSKILRLKNGYALKEPLVFESPGDKIFYEKILGKHVKKAGNFMIGFGRGVVVINERGVDLSTPQIGELGPYKLDVFSGDMVTAQDVSIDLSDKRYQKPKYYNIRDKQFHHSRVIDFRYVEPPEIDLPEYQYGGISEFDLIYQQLINDGVIERASASIIEKSSTLFYKVKGYKDALNAKQEAALKQFFSLTENARSIYGAGIIDSEDDVLNIDQKLNNLDSVDQISLRRLAMVTGIPFPFLLGESPKGLNATGTIEKQIFNEMIGILQEDYYLTPINELMFKIGKGPISFSENQHETPIDKMEFDTKAIINAKALWEMGEDHESYLENRGVIEKDAFAETFESDDLADIPGIPQNEGLPAEDEPGKGGEIDPTASLNGAQVTALLDVIRQVSTGVLPKETAVLILSSAFPVSVKQAEDIMKNVVPGSVVDGNV